jgi:predicted PurR-regulated permease PerM
MNRAPGRFGQQPEPSAPAAAQDTPPAPPAPTRRPADRSGRTALIILAVAAVLTVCYLAKLVIIAVLVSILLAFVLEPFVRALSRIRIPRQLAAALAVALAVVAFYSAAFEFYNRAVDFAAALPKSTVQIRQALTSFRRQAQQLQRATETILPDPREQGRILTVRQQTAWSELLTRGFVSVSDLVFVVSCIPFLVYFMLTWHDHARNATVALFRPEHREQAYVTLGQIAAMIRSFIIGNVLIGVLLAGASMLAFAMLGLPYPFLIGAISGVVSLVPYAGVVLAVIPPVLAGIGQIGGSDLAAIVLTAIALHVVAINVLYPKLLGRRLQLNPLVVTLSLLGWGWLWGAMGLILAVPITGAMKIIFDHVDPLRPYGAWMGE